MLHVIKRSLNKTPIQNSSTLLYQLDGIHNENVRPLLSSHLLSEGVYGYEVMSNSEFTEGYLFTPAIFRENVGKESYQHFTWLQDEIKNAYCYEIVLAKPSFLPLYIQKSYSLLHNLTLIPSKNAEIFIQFLFTKRNDQWQEELIQQYEEYIKGNDYPSTSKLGRKLQQKALKIITKIGGFDVKRDEIEQIEQKILENGYRFELRMVVVSPKFNKKRFDNELRGVLKEADYFNELTYIPVKDKKLFIRNVIDRKFSPTSIYQTLSESELVTLISDDMDVMINKSSTDTEPQIRMNKPFKNDFMRLVNLLPVGEKKERKIDNEIVASLPSALKKAKAIKEGIEVVDVELGATVQKITCKIPKGIVYSDIKGKHEDIKAALATEINIIQGNEPNTITFLIPCKERDIIYLKELLENPNFIEYASEQALPFICGVDVFNRPVYKDLTEAPQLLVAGATGGGKSVFIVTLLITLILLKSPNELRLYLIDPKMVEFEMFKGIPHIEEVITNMKDAYETLNGIVNEMEKRYTAFAKIGVKKIDAYNRKSNKKMPYIVCAIDEYNDLKMLHPEVEELIERLGQKARGAGIHLILGTQRPDKDVISGVIKTNLPSRISFKLDNASDYRTVFGTGIGKMSLLGFGDGVVKYVGQVEEFIRFQAPVITLDEIEEEKTYDRIKKAFKGEQVEGIELEPVEIEEPIDKLKRMIATTGETRATHLRSEMGIRGEIMSELMLQLVDEGFLIKNGLRYEVAASEDELDEWRG